RLQRYWRKRVTRGPVPWYLEAKIQRGAYAALVGLSLRDAETSEQTGGSWRVVAVGDSCAFHVRDDELLTVAPLSTSDEFNNHPHLISTNASSSFGLRRSRIKVAAGEGQPSDMVFLLTDALAQWSLAMHEAGRPPWHLFRGLGREGADEGQRAFETLVATLRESGELHNDDTTLLRVEVS
ncbi:MAG: hypothetical protein P8Y95_16840, partial [Gammaproteobacteria bacterium]